MASTVRWVLNGRQLGSAPYAAVTRAVNGRAVLPFDEPPRSVLRGSAKLVWAHYMPLFRRSIDNRLSGDYYDRYWMPPGATEGAADHREYGGLVRDRPLRRASISGTDWTLDDKKEEIRQAMAAGIDGFAVDIHGLDGWPMEHTLELIEAANALSFRILLVPDGSSAATSDPTALANAIARLAAHPTVYRNNGRLVLAPFAPELAPSNKGTGGVAARRFWEAVRTRLKAHSIDVSYMFCYVMAWPSPAQAPAFDSIAWGHSRWGSRDPEDSLASSRFGANYCRTTFKKPWMQPVSAQDSRPRSGLYWEAGNAANLRETWRAAIEQNAQWVQLTTWNDYAENTHMAPSVNHGWSWLDINAYYTTWFKLGSPPPIIRDGIYLSHRTQLTNGTQFTSKHKLLQKLAGATPARDTAEVMCFLTAPAVVSITSGGRTSTHHVPAGVSAVTMPLGIGPVTSQVTRNGKIICRVTSFQDVGRSAQVQDMHYRVVSSLRQAAGQLHT